MEPLLLYTFGLLCKSVLLSARPAQVKGIQDEYQNFMEKVRGKAQHAIDMANRNFESDRTELTSQVDVLVHVMHSRFYYQVICSSPSMTVE